MGASRGGSGLSKYGNRKVDNRFGHFDSQKEFLHYLLLADREKRGEISDLKMQVPFLLIPKQDGERECTYVADFTYKENGKLVVEDVKGMRTEVYRIKRKLMLYVHHIKIKEID